MTPVEQIREKLANMEEALEGNLPGIATMLRTIHSQLKKDEEIVTLLTEEEVCMLVRGLKKQTLTEITTAAINAPRKKALKATTLDDL